MFSECSIIPNCHPPVDMACLDKILEVIIKLDSRWNGANYKELSKQHEKWTSIYKYNSIKITINTVKIQKYT